MQSRPSPLSWAVSSDDESAFSFPKVVPGFSLALCWGVSSWATIYESDSMQLINARGRPQRYFSLTFFMKDMTFDGNILSRVLSLAGGLCEK